MNFKKLSLALCFACLNVSICYAEIDLPVRNAYSAITAEGNAQFILNEGTVGSYQYVQLSKYSDFSVIDGFGYIRPSKYPATVNMNRSNRVHGTYYWRIYDEGSGKYFYGDDRTITYGEKPAEAYVPVEDATEYEDIPLDGGKSMQLKSLWFRSVNTSNRVAKMVDFPHDNKKDISADCLTPNQSCVIRDGVIYISRGSSSNISGWATDRTRMWLARYDLLTGEELPMLWVKSPGSNGFVTDEWSIYFAMNWIHEDADGIPYFFVISNKAEKPKVTMSICIPSILTICRWMLKV